MIAADQAQNVVPPPLLAALQEVAQSCGPWWAFEHAAVLTDRPAEIHVNDRYLLHRADGPAAVYRDGAAVWAWNGDAVPEDWIVHPEAIARGYLRAADPAFRRHVEQRASRTPAREPTGRPRNLLNRYMAGEHERVWLDLIALGADVRKPRYEADALAVARETMRRVAANVRTVVSRLHLLGYRFKTEGDWLDTVAARSESLLDMPGAAESPFAERLRESTERLRNQRRLADYEFRAHISPGPDTTRHLDELEDLVGPLPFSLRAFYEIVGEVDLIGTHDTISPESDPLVVFSLEAVLQECAAESSNEVCIPIAPDHYHKADISGGAPYEIAVPDLRADAELLNESHNLFFVDYLRLAFRNGGFPGYDGHDRGVPKEIAILTDGLEQF